MTSPNPYSALPPSAFWRRSISNVAPDAVDPVGSIDLTISRETKVATAGSCFAQHIARRLRESGYTYFVSEMKPNFLDEDIAEKFNYGTFSARFGNLYTSRQLVQLVERAYGLFTPIDDVWLEGEDSFIDPYRPAIQPGGFSSAEEYREDRRGHYVAVRRMIEDCDLFVFTLGLTECWVNRTDGAVYPLCPGTAGGEFDPDKHAFVNLSVGEVVKDLQRFVELLGVKNPRAKVLLTVSPVPLIATATSRHVLAATTYSKSVLRVAVDLVVAEYKNVFYLPSYEIITGAFSRGRYFGDDCRDITEFGVDHVMKLFFRHVAGVELESLRNDQRREDVSVEEATLAVVKAICDEERLDSLAN